MAQRLELIKAGSRRLSMLPRTETLHYDDDTESSASLGAALSRSASANVRYAWTGDQQVRRIARTRAFERMRPMPRAVI